MADHYYTNMPESVSEERAIEYESPAGRLSLVTDRGVFSGSRVDFGSDLLIRTVAVEEAERCPRSVLDLGCGYGPIGISLGLAFPEAHVAMGDVNERAMELSRRNAASAGVQAEVFDNTAFAPEGPFELAVTNPPIRAGKKVVYGLFEEAFGLLSPGGRLYAVIQKKQGADSAEAFLKECFGNCETVGRDAGYRILRSVKEF